MDTCSRYSLLILLINKNPVKFIELTELIKKWNKTITTTKIFTCPIYTLACFAVPNQCKGSGKKGPAYFYRLAGSHFNNLSGNLIMIIHIMI